MSTNFTYDNIDGDLIKTFFIDNKNKHIQYVLSHKKFYKNVSKVEDRDEVSMYFLIALENSGIISLNTNSESNNHFKNFVTTTFKYKGNMYNYKELNSNIGIDYMKLRETILRYSELYKKQNIFNPMYSNLNLEKISQGTFKRYNTITNDNYENSTDVSNAIKTILNKLQDITIKENTPVKYEDYYNIIKNTITDTIKTGGDDITIPDINWGNKKNFEDNDIVNIVVNCILNNNPQQFKQCAHSLANTSLTSDVYKKFAELPLNIRISILKALDVKLKESVVNGKKKYNVETFEDWTKRHTSDNFITIEGITKKETKREENKQNKNPAPEEKKEQEVQEEQKDAEVDLNAYAQKTQEEKEKEIMKNTIDNIKNTLITNNNLKDFNKKDLNYFKDIIENDLKNNEFNDKNINLANDVLNVANGLTGGKIYHGGNKDATYDLVKYIVHILIDSVINEQGKLTDMYETIKSRTPNKTKISSSGLKYAQPRKFEMPNELYRRNGVFPGQYAPIDLIHNSNIDEQIKYFKTLHGYSGGSEGENKQSGGSSVFKQAFNVLTTELKNKNKPLTENDSKQIVYLIEKLETLEKDTLEIIGNIAKYNKNAKIDEDGTPITYDDIQTQLELLQSTSAKQSESQNEILALFAKFYGILNEIGTKTSSKDWDKLINPSQ